MYPPNVARILDFLKPSDVLLDIGGWACPFNRANYVMDAQPYATRGFYQTVGLPASQGGEVEYFTTDTWIVRDICNHQPYPFKDKELDFVICSHTLEDVRDPLWVCSEMMRIAKRGYIEIPSRMAESCRGWESDQIAGLSHHRWLIDVDERTSSLRFLMKHHMIHSHWKYSFRPSFFRRLPHEKRVSWLFWEGSFTAAEITLYGQEAIANELAEYIARVRPYPHWQLRAAHMVEAVRRRVRRVVAHFT